jgi:hypothetical protein
MKLKRTLTALVAGLALAGAANATNYNSGVFHPPPQANYTYFDFGLSFANLVNDATEDITGAHLFVIGNNVDQNEATVEVLNGATWTSLGYLTGPSTDFWLGNIPGFFNYLEGNPLKVRVFNANLAGMTGAQLTGTVFAVPEPTGLAMLLAGIGAIGFMSRRRKSS